MSSERRRFLARNSGTTDENTNNRSSGQPAQAEIQTSFPYAVDAPDWDEEAIEQARAQANALFDRDANDTGARLLLERAQRAEARLLGDDVPSSTRTLVDTATAFTSASTSQRKPSSKKPLDLMRLKARVAKYYGCFSDTELQRMPFKRFIAYVREMEIMQQEEQDAYNNTVGEHGPNSGGYAMVDGKRVDPEYAASQVAGYIPQARAYTGPRVALSD